MMRTGLTILADLCFDIATAQHLGQRDCQEDAVVAHFAQGNDMGFVVLADGMGGHAAGDVAARIVATEVFSELLFQSADPVVMQQTMAATLRQAALAADACIAAYVAEHPHSRGMGSTLIAPVIAGGGMWWISIGDSPLFLLRDGQLRQVNEDHSLAPQIDFMAARGLIDPQTARDHPDRNVLTSALFGDRVARVDCPDQPLALRPGDLIVVASDGLQFLDDAGLTRALQAGPGAGSAAMARNLMAAVLGLNDPDQDNVSFCLIRVDAAAQGQGDTAQSAAGGADGQD